MKYRKKPVVIEAAQYDGTFPLDFLRGAENVRAVDHGRAVEIETLEGTMRADIGDWIIRGVQGESWNGSPTRVPTESSDRSGRGARPTNASGACCDLG